MGNAVTTPRGVMRPILFAVISTNQRFPSGPCTMPYGPAFLSGSGNSTTAPSVLMRPILPAALSVNQRLPSGPWVIWDGRGSEDGTCNGDVFWLGVVAPRKSGGRVRTVMVPLT